MHIRIHLQGLYVVAGTRHGSTICSVLVLYGLFSDSWKVCRYVHVPNPAFDYVAPELISLFVTDTGGYTPSYVYRLLAEYYSSQDWLLDDIETYP